MPKSLINEKNCWCRFSFGINALVTVPSTCSGEEISAIGENFHPGAFWHMYSENNF